MMADSKEDRIDFGKLEKELESAMQADAKYWRENDAKLRAVEQRVETYEQFRDMVAAAHLRPLDKKDRISECNKLQQPWNPLVQDKEEQKQGQQTDKDLVTGELPSNSLEFTRDWRRSKDDRYGLLKSIGSERLCQVLKNDIGMNTLGEIVTALSQSYSQEETLLIMDILKCLPNCGRFSLAVDFLGQKDKETLQELFKQLDTDIGTKERIEEIQELRKVYKVS